MRKSWTVQREDGIIVVIGPAGSRKELSEGQWTSVGRGTIKAIRDDRGILQPVCISASGREVSTIRLGDKPVVVAPEPGETIVEVGTGRAMVTNELGIDPSYVIEFEGSEATVLTRPGEFFSDGSVAADEFTGLADCPRRVTIHNASVVVLVSTSRVPDPKHPDDKDRWINKYDLKGIMVSTCCDPQTFKTLIEEASAKFGFPLGPGKDMGSGGSDCE